MDRTNSLVDYHVMSLPLQSFAMHEGATSVQQVEQRSFNAWPASRNSIVGNWLLRSHHGYTKRANSANALQPGPSLNVQLLRHIEAWYAHQHLPCIFRLSPLADFPVDALLHAEWACGHGATHTDLQVLDGNVPAQSLYSSLGFQAAYGYHYRVKR